MMKLTVFSAILFSLICGCAKGYIRDDRDVVSHRLSNDSNSGEATGDTGVNPNDPSVIRSLAHYAANEKKKTAQDKADDCVLLLIQSGLGMNTSDAIRKSLAKRFTFSVVTMRDITTRDQRPHLLLTLARDHRGTLSALFWSSDGRVEVFSAEAPRQPEALLVAAVTLASAVVERFVGEGNPPPICNSRVSLDGDLFAELGRGVVIPAYYRVLRYFKLIRARSGELLIEDF